MLFNAYAYVSRQYVIDHKSWYVLNKHGRPPSDPILYKEKLIFHAWFVENWSKLTKITHYPPQPTISGSTPDQKN